MNKILEIIVARLKQSGKILVWVVPLIVMFVAMIVTAVLLLQKKKRVEASTGIPGKVAQGINEIADKLSETNIQAKVEVAAARAEDKAVKTEIKAILANKDTAARRRQLIALHERLDATP